MRYNNIQSLSWVGIDIIHFFTDKGKIKRVSFSRIFIRRRMKILHTSDWHIGKKLINRDRLDEQEQVLNELLLLCEEREVELILVAGDVFDTFLPSAEAENLFFGAVRKLAGENRAVLIVSGNHDDGKRLCAAAPFAEELGVYIVGNGTGSLPLTSSRAVRPVLSGQGYVVFENKKGERVYVNTLPYPNEARFKEEHSEESYKDKVLRWIDRGQSAYDGTCPEIFLSHLFVAGGNRSDGERDIDLGGARVVELDWLPKCDYVALGHLHKKQCFSKYNAWYSGSLLEYSFDEAGLQKYAVLLETDEKTVLSTEEIPLQSGKKLIRLQSKSVENALGLLAENGDKHVELTLTLDAPLTSEETHALSAHKCLVSLIPQVKMQLSAGEVTGRKGKSKQELFDDYYRSVYGAEPSTELKSLFLEIVQEEEEGA